MNNIIDLDLIRWYYEVSVLGSCDIRVWVFDYLKRLKDGIDWVYLEVYMFLFCIAEYE